MQAFNIQKLGEIDQEDLANTLTERIDDFKLVDLEKVWIYRGINFHQDEGHERIVSFWTESIEEAKVYSRYPPYEIYGKKKNWKLIDFHQSENKEVFREILQEKIGKPAIVDGLLKGFIPDQGQSANNGFEDDFCLLISQFCLQNQIHGFYRTTYSATLTRNARELCLYKEFLHIEV